MPDDEPLDDLRAVAMTAGAAAARVVETVIRDAQNRAQQQAHAVDAQRRQAAAHTALATGQTLTGTPYDSAPRVAPPTDLDQAMTWAMREAPRSLEEYETDWANSDTSDGRRSADRALVKEWKTATYDNPERRAVTDQAMRTAGVPDEARQARTTADLLNGTDPQLAARSGPAAPGRPSRPPKTPQRDAGDERPRRPESMTAVTRDELRAAIADAMQSQPDAVSRAQLLYDITRAGYDAIKARNNGTDADDDERFSAGKVSDEALAHKTASTPGHVTNASLAPDYAPLAACDSVFCRRKSAECCQTSSSRGRPLPPPTLQ